MTEQENLQPLLPIEHRIFTLRGQQVMLDSDLAELYGVTTGRFNEQVKRNVDRFPEDFMFKISGGEWENLISQNAISRWGGRRKSPYVFTEQGVAGLSGILRSPTAVKVHIEIMRAFVKMRRQLTHYSTLSEKVEWLTLRQLNSEENFEKIFKALDNKISLPQTDIFFNGQVFDAWRWVSDVIRSADTSIMIVDNYLNDNILTLLAKRKNGVQSTLYTSKITPSMLHEAEKFNRQYGDLEIRLLHHCHDRFLIIDKKKLYHFGASLKDLGKKWFAFSRIDSLLPALLERLEKS